MRDWEGHTPKSDLAKPQTTQFYQPNLDLLERIDRHDDERVARKLKESLKDFELEKIRDHADIARAYQSIAAFIVQFGHHENHRKQMSVLIKALEGFAHHRKEYMSVDFPKEIIRTMRSGLTGIAEAIMPMLGDKADQDRIGNLFKDMITNLEKLNNGER